MKILERAGVALLLACSNLSCSVNILENFADKNTNEAIFIDAQKLINAKDYAGAIAKLDLLTGAYPEERKVVYLRATAYGGICGLEFMPFVLALKDLGSQRPLPFIMGHFRGGTGASIDACTEAVRLVNSLGELAARSVDENLFMAMLNFARIGAVLSYYGDGDGDGAADGGYDPCLRANSARPATAGAGDFLPADLRELGAGLTNALANLAAVSSRVDLGSGSLDSVAGACTSLAGVDPAYDFCAILDPADFTADHLRALATLINESTAVGLGTCTGNAVACLCGP